MSAPLFRDPVFDGATDPTVIRKRGTDEWWMFYTQRRSSVDEPGVAWVHGSRIGRAVSTDAGETWEYRGALEGLDDGGNTHWAPELIDDGDEYRMYLTIVSGIPSQWEGVPRHILEYRSADLEHWELRGRLELSSDRVIDAAVARCADGRYRLWYKDEGHDSTTWAAVSDDLESWAVEGMAVGFPSHEGPNVFVLGEWYWMIVDEWHGLAVYRSADGIEWQRQDAAGGLILDRPGADPLDRNLGHHADVVVLSNEPGVERASVFYFTHVVGETDETAADAFDRRRCAVHVASLTVEDGVLLCDRDVAAAGCLAVSTDEAGFDTGARQASRPTQPAENSDG